MPARPFRAALLICLSAPLLGACAFFGIERPGAEPVDPSRATYRAAMADFSACTTAPDAATAARLAEAAARMQAEARPSDPDHFFMTDRVTAAATYCAEAVAR